jgi:uncharacterized membrane protein YeaQ/YmgE (transglycosylase-associated protein family)
LEINRQIERQKMWPFARPVSRESVRTKTFAKLKKGNLKMLLTTIVWILFGGMAGWLAGSIMKRDEMWPIDRIAVGMVGAFIGGFLMNLFGVAGVTGFDLYSLLVAIVGAVVLLFLVGTMRRRLD